MGRQTLGSLRKLTLLASLFVISAGTAAAQRTVRVVDGQGQRIAFASVIVDKNSPLLTDELGEVKISTKAGKAFNLDVRRIGFVAAQQKVEAADTNSTISVALKAGDAAKMANQLSAASSPRMMAYYRRAMDSQKRNGQESFISPEEIERRNPARTTALFQGVNGISLKRSSGAVQIMSRDGSCALPLLIDGELPQGTDKDIDQLVPIGELVSAEVYPRGVTPPPELRLVDDIRCGLVAIWTTRRR